VLVAVGLIVAGCSSDASGDGDSSPTATFDGASCVYDGPDEFEAGSEVTFTLVDTSGTMSVGLGVWKVSEGLTPERILDEGIFNYGSVVNELAAEVTDVGFQVTFLLSDPGPYALNCADRPEGGPALDYATFFTVVG